MEIFLEGEVGGVLKISSNVTKGIRGRGHQNVSIQSTPPLCSSLFRWDVCVPLPRLGRGGIGKGRTTRLLPIMVTCQGKTPTFPIFFKKQNLAKLRGGAHKGW